MRILLINPPVPDIDSNRDSYISSGLLYISSALKKENVEIDFIDFVIEPFKEYKKILEDKIKSFNPLFIGIGGKCCYSRL